MTDSDYSIGDKVISKYEFKALHPNEMSFSHKKIVNIVSKGQNGWICGETSELIGWFPEDYVKLYQKKSVATPLATPLASAPQHSPQSRNQTPRAANPSPVVGIGEAGNFIARTLTSLFTTRESRDSLVTKGILKLGLVFGVPLDILIESTRSTIPPICSQCFNAIERNGIRESGIYRLSGSLAEVLELKQQYNTGTAPSLSNVNQNTVASLVKLFFRELVEPLFTFRLYDQILEVGRSERENRVPKLINVVNQLPKNRKNLLTALLQHLDKVASHSSTNLMNPKNIAICFAPTLIRKEVETLQSSMQDAKYLVSFMDSILSNSAAVISGNISTTTTETSTSSTPVARHPPVAVNSPPVEEFLCYVVSKFPYTGRNEKELTFSEGDIIGIKKKGQSGWWKGVLNGNKGMVANTYIQELDPNDPRIPRKARSTPSRSPSQSRGYRPKRRVRRGSHPGARRLPKAQSELQAKLSRRRQQS